MADNTNKGTPQKETTPEPSIVVSNAVPQVENVQTIAQPEKKSNKDLTIEEIDSKLRGGDLFIEERIALNEQRDLLIEESRSSTDEGGNTGGGGKAVNNRGKSGIEERDIDKIKEDDIINYMWNEWMLASANYGTKKAFYVLDYSIDWLDRQITNEQQQGDPNKQTATQKLLGKFNATFQKGLKDIKDQSYPSGDFIRNTAEAVRNRDFSQLPDISPENKERIQNADDATLERLFGAERTEETIEEFTKTDKRVQTFSYSYAAAKIYDGVAKGEYTLKTKSMAEDIKKEAALVEIDMYKWISTQAPKGSSEADFERFYATWQKMQDDVNNGYLKSMNQVRDGHHHDSKISDKPYKTPDELNNIETIFETARNQSTEPMSLYEFAKKGKLNLNDTLKKQLDEANLDSSASTAHINQNEERRETGQSRTERLRNRIGAENPDYYTDDNTRRSETNGPSNDNNQQNNNNNNRTPETGTSR